MILKVKSLHRFNQNINKLWICLLLDITRKVYNKTKDMIIIINLNMQKEVNFYQKDKQHSMFKNI